MTWLYLVQDSNGGGGGGACKCGNVSPGLIKFGEFID
jgi:hypothetical protein